MNGIDYISCNRYIIFKLTPPVDETIINTKIVSIENIPHNSTPILVEHTSEIDFKNLFSMQEFEVLKKIMKTIHSIIFEVERYTSDVLLYKNRRVVFKHKKKYKTISFPYTYTRKINVESPTRKTFDSDISMK